MKRNILTLILAGAALLFSCTPEGENGLPSGFVFQERSIVSLKFEHQIGDAVITALDDSTGMVEVKLAVDYIDNMASVDVSSLVISYGATATCKMGDKMDLTASNPTIKVTSQSGTSRTYSILVTPFAEDFAGNYAITGSYLIGGLGADDGWGWGTMGMGAPEDRSWCWDTNGYGPAANYDNYLEIVCTGINDDGSTEGTCVNYGGADGKHWNCIIYKTDAGIVSDVHKYYRVIPIGNSTWKRDYTTNTITFTSEGGKQTTCSIFDGTVVVSATYQKSFDIPDQAFGFAIAGDYTWDDSLLYTDYQKFGVAARYIFLMVSKVADIPAASKVIGDEGVIDIPEPGDDPGEDPGEEPADLSSFAGDYLVKSLKILGGGRTGFDEIKDKPWDWTGYTDKYHATNANKEYDNTLTVTISGNGGTLNYGAGADGEFWDYTYKNNMNGTNNDYGDITVDMSFNFGQLPHGESSFTIDPATMVVTIKDSGNKTVYGQVYGSGKHTDPATSVSLDVPTGCFALAFQLTPYSGTEYTYEDRFSSSDLNMIVFHPNYYVMIFEKQ